jgi:hypothetical protein
MDQLASSLTGNWPHYYRVVHSKLMSYNVLTNSINNTSKKRKNLKTICCSETISSQIFGSVHNSPNTLYYLLVGLTSSETRSQMHWKSTKPPFHKTTEILALNYKEFWTRMAHPYRSMCMHNRIVWRPTKFLSDVPRMYAWEAQPYCLVIPDPKCTENRFIKSTNPPFHKTTEILTLSYKLLTETARFWGTIFFRQIGSRSHWCVRTCIIVTQSSESAQCRLDLHLFETGKYHGTIYVHA